MKKKATPVSPAFHVLLDTNALYTEHAAKLLSPETSEFILNSAKPLGLTLTWYLPKIVEAERRRQMINEGSKLLSPLRKLEMLLEMNLAINEETVLHRVDKIIADHILEHDIIEWDAPHADSNWERMIDAAVNKTPPFSPTEKNEKGFKDAIVLEAFCKLVATAPRSRQTARVVLVSADALLREAARGRTVDHKNVLIVMDLAELNSHLYAHASQIDEERVPLFTERATALFFQVEKRNCLNEREEVFKTIREECAIAMDKSPRAGFTVQIESIVIHPQLNSEEDWSNNIFLLTVFKFGSRPRVRWLKRPQHQTVHPTFQRLTEQDAQAKEDAETLLGKVLADLFAIDSPATRNSEPSFLGEILGRTKIWREKLSGEMNVVVGWQATIDMKAALSKTKVLDMTAKDPVWSAEVTKTE